jgi:hypothetical protein
VKAAAKLEIARIAARVDAAFAAFDATLADAGERRARRAPSISPWSPLEVAEHVALTNRFLWILVDKIAVKARSKLARGEVPPSTAPNVNDLELVARHDFRWEAPAHMRPTGEVPFEVVRATLAAQRASASAHCAEMPAGEGSLHTIKMSVVGPEARLDLYQFLAFAALHVERHTLQVQRILAALERPAP